MGLITTYSGLRAKKGSKIGRKTPFVTL